MFLPGNQEDISFLIVQHLHILITTTDPIYEFHDNCAVCRGLHFPFTLVAKYNKTQGLQLHTVSDKSTRLLTLLTPEGHVSIELIITIYEIVFRETTFKILYS